MKRRPSLPVRTNPRPSAGLREPIVTSCRLSMAATRISSASKPALWARGRQRGRRNHGGGSRSAGPSGPIDPRRVHGKPARRRSSHGPWSWLSRTPTVRSSALLRRAGRSGAGTQNRSTGRGVVFAEPGRLRAAACGRPRARAQPGTSHWEGGRSPQPPCHRRKWAGLVMRRGCSEGRFRSDCLPRRCGIRDAPGIASVSSPAGRP